jgi:cyclophilin family peptidyl-prolyl cis-trans isomerase
MRVYEQTEETDMKKLVVAGMALALAACGARAADPVVMISTSMGDIKVQLDAERAPITVKNFLSYVDDKFYDDTVYHRVIKNFMIQGGGFEKGMDKAKNATDFKAKEKKTKDPIQNESGNGLSNTRGSIAMARTNNPDSATAQFFINVQDNQRLDPARYCVFGKVIDGMDVVDKIREVKTHTIKDPRYGAIGDVPDEDVVIKSIRRVEN